jgi:hypothetical protein
LFTRKYIRRIEISPQDFCWQRNSKDQPLKLMEKYEELRNDALMQAAELSAQLPCGGAGKSVSVLMCKSMYVRGIGVAGVGAFCSRNAAHGMSVGLGI